PSATYTLSLHDALPIYRRGDDLAQLGAVDEGFLTAFLEGSLAALLERLRADRAGRVAQLVAGDVRLVRVVPCLERLGEIAHRGEDRKSTRLNSSHGTIS